ncbi:MAG: glycosyltransferase family 4 protein [Rhodospirillales bacterium]|nr:glycosyltransferase family 4 protein [Rhodospirillales bacterium]
MTRLGSSQSLALLNPFEVVVATTNNQGMALALLRRLGRLEARVLFIPMGVLPAGASPLRRAVTRRLLRGVTLAPLSRAEERYLVDALGPDQDVACLPFGVDDRFWTPPPDGAPEGGYVLSIGNDRCRDYATLAAAWRPEYPPLKIVTRLAVPASDGAVEVIAGDWNRQILEDAEVRELFRGARFVVLPLTETIQPSGQSACLQAMACGKAVVISDIAGLFDRGALADGETCVLVPPGSVADLGNRIEGLLGDGGRAQAIGRRARQAVEEHFTIDIMAAGLKQRLESLLAAGPPP